MSEARKGFWAWLMRPKKSSGCCSIKIEEEEQGRANAAAESEAAAKQKAETGPEAQRLRPARCCGGPTTPTRRDGGSCCG